MKKSTILCLTALIAMLALGSRCNFKVVCEIGETQECICLDGAMGTQACNADGSGWEECECAAEVVCEDGETQGCFCPDGTTGNQSCNADGSGWEVCECIDDGEQWCDETSDLCWQDPPYQKGRGLCWHAAINYCDQLSFDGYDDWRLPNLNEERTLVRNCPTIEAGGDCPIEDGSDFDDWMASGEICLECYTEISPETICFWPQELQGTCNRIDEHGSPVEWWSSSPVVDEAMSAEYAWYVWFGMGVVGYNHSNSYGDVRCVRDKSSYSDEPVCAPNDTEECTCEGGGMGAKKCSSDGSGWGECVCPGYNFSEVCVEETIDPSDCSKVTLTIKIPEEGTCTEGPYAEGLEPGDEGVPCTTEGPNESECGTNGVCTFFPSDGWNEINGWFYAPGRIHEGPPEAGWEPIYENADLEPGSTFEMTITAINLYKTACKTGEYTISVTIATDPADPQVAQWEAISDPGTVIAGIGDVVYPDVLEVKWFFHGELTR